MPRSSKGARQPLGENANKANQSPAAASIAKTSKGATAPKEPEQVDLTSNDAMPAFTMMSGGSASKGKTVDGRPPPSFGQSLSGAGRKRKSDGPPAESVNLDDYDVEGMPMDKNPDQVRRRIRRFLNNGGMKVEEFCNALGVSNKDYSRFMQQSGRTKGLSDDVYSEAWAFFAKREMTGLKMPNKKQKTSSTSNAGSSSGSAKGSFGKSVNISGIHLDGQEHDNVLVFDSCDEIRRKITAHLGKQGVTKAQLCRELHAQLQSADAPAKIQSSQLDRFRGNNGATAGCTGSVYYAAYVFFEKHRIAEGKAKSKHRQEMERVWPSGVERDRDGNQRGYLCHKSERPHEDKYGRVSFY